MNKSYLIVIISCLILASCGGSSTIKRAPTSNPSNTNTSNNGGYYGNDGPHDTTPDNLDSIPDAIPKVEALYKYSSKPYIALGKKYYPLETAKGYKNRGVASWYGKMFHGKKTAIGETYDMYSMTAAHTTLPLPSYVKVTNLDNGRSVIVRVNDRGPFKHEREIDLSYAAAYKLRLIEKGSGFVEVEAIDPTQYVPPQNTVKESAPVPAAKTTTIAQHYVQAGAFGDENNAIALQNRIAALDIEEVAKINRMYNDGLYRLTVGPYQTKEQAEKVAKIIQNRLNTSTIITIK
jgi:rare lipoprotein A